MGKTQPDPFDDWETAYDAPEVMEAAPQAKKFTALNVHAPIYQPGSSSTVNYTILPSSNPASPLPSIITAPQMQILQRSASSEPTSRSASPSAQKKEEKTMEQRLQEYQNARDRIFKEEEARRLKADEKKVAVERQPTLPTDGVAGFGARAKARPT